jgi:hypothetical protein
MARLTDPKHVAGLLHGLDVRPLVLDVIDAELHVDDRLGASPVTEVEPTCSMRRATSPRAEKIRCRSFSKPVDQVGSQS